MNWRTVLFFLIVGVALYIIVPQLIGVKHALLLLHTMNKLWLLAAAIVEFLFYFGVAVLLWVIVDVLNVKVKIWDLIKISFLSNFALHVLPVGGLGSAVVNYYFLKLKGLSAGQTIIALVMKAVFTYLALGILLFVSIIYLPTHAQLSRLQLYIIVGLIILALSILGYLIYLYWHKDYFHRVAQKTTSLVNRVYRLFRKEKRIAPEGVATTVEEVYEGFKLFDEKRQSIPFALLGGLLTWLGDIVCLGVVFLAFGYHIHIGVLIFAYVIANLLAMVSWIPGGIGVIEGSLALIIIGFGAPAEITWMSVLVFRLLSFWLPIPVGMISFYSLLSQAKKEKLDISKAPI